MAPKQMTQAAIAKLVSDEVAKALAEDRATRDTTVLVGPANRKAEANGKSWDDMKKMMLEEFCPEEEISRMEDELFHLSKEDQSLNQGVPSYIQGETYSSKPTTLNEAIRMAHGLMEQKVQGWKEKNAEQNKRKWEGGNQGNNQGNRGNNRGDNRDNHRLNLIITEGMKGARAMTTSSSEIVTKEGHAPKCNRCNEVPFGNCPMKSNKCGKMGHMLRIVVGKRKKKLDGRNASGHIYAVKDVDQAQGPNVVTGLLADNDARQHLCKKDVHIPIKNLTASVKGDSNSSD
ncbi:hypothetical protein Tco_1321570 [Tanacetum coccineum]